MQVEINGEAKEIPAGASLQSLIESLALAPERVAVELNMEVIRRSEWAQVSLAEGDRVEIVHFVGGGGRRQKPSR